jgi:SRSO17 transposase
MEAAEFERVYEDFRDFHAFFAPTFGRVQWREHSMHYLQALLVQSQERRNAENLAEMVPVSARALQRFLTEARWDDEALICRLQEYLSPRLTHPLADWVFDGSDFPKQGVKSVGVTRQYCGALGKVANCQARIFLAHVGPLGRALVDKRLYLPEGWTSDPARCTAAGVPEAQRRYRAKTDLALEMLRQARARGHLSAEWAAGDDAFGMSPVFRDGLTAEGMQYVLDVPPATTVWPLEPTWSSPAYHGRGRPAKPKPRLEERLTVKERSLAQPPEAWREITVAEGVQRPRTYRFSAQRVRETRDRQPGGVLWAVYRQNLDGSEPRYYLSNGPEDTPLETLARVGGSRWPIETEFETEKSDVGLDEYETRTWAGWHHHITLCLLAGAFLLSLQQEWGKKYAPDYPPAGLPSGAGDVAPGAVRAGGVVTLAGGCPTAQ